MSTQLWWASWGMTAEDRISLRHSVRKWDVISPKRSAKSVIWAVFVCRSENAGGRVDVCEDQGVGCGRE